jgi:sporulation protein YlmC with PRC-barrel domain
MAETNGVGLMTLKDSDLMLAHATDDVRGLTVTDAQGDSIGEVDDLIVDERERRARFLVVKSGGFLGLGETKRLVPVDAVSAVDDKVHIEPSREEVHGSLEFDPELEPWPDFEGVYNQYGYTPFWGPGYMSPGYFHRRP